MNLKNAFVRLKKLRGEAQTNVLVVNVPNRFDLGKHSCVNHEV